MKRSRTAANKRPQKRKKLTAIRRYYRPSELALEFGVSDDSIWSWVRQGILPSVKLGRAVLLPKDRVDEIMKQRTREVAKV